MGIYMCEVCGAHKDDDYNVPEEWGSGLICESCAEEKRNTAEENLHTWSMFEKVRNELFEDMSDKDFDAEMAKYRTFHKNVPEPSEDDLLVWAYIAQL